MTVRFRRPEPLLIEAGPHAVLLLHAYSGSSNDMGLLGRGLARAGYTVYAPIFSGHGTLEPKDILTQGSVPQWLADAKAAVQRLRTMGYQQIAVFGLSMGGLFATRLLETDDQLVGGGTFASPVIRVGETNVPQSFIELSRKIYDREPLDETKKQANLDWLAQHNPQQLAEIEAFVRDEVDPHLDQIKRPFFIGQGDTDEMINARSGAAFYDAMIKLGKQVSFHVYPGAGHVLTVNQAHHQLQDDVETFLKNLFN